MLKIKRIYEKKEDEDGYRILVDRLWPRGISKETADLDKWYKEIAPSNSLRKDFNHKKDMYPSFKEDYLREIKDNNKSKDFLDLVRDKLKFGNVTLLYGAKDKEHNQAQVLKEWIEKKIKSS